MSPAERKPLQCFDPWDEGPIPDPGNAGVGMYIIQHSPRIFHIAGLTVIQPYHLGFPGYFYYIKEER